MNFANLSWPWVLAGVAGLAGLLYLVQRLRIRYTEVAVPTAMLWREAVRDAPVRVFRRRFRHWLAYLFSLLICCLLWLGLAEPRLDAPEGSDYHVLFLDGSAHMSAPGDLQRAIESLREDLRGIAENRREVIWGGAWNQKLLDAGEASLLFERRLDGLAPDGAPSAVEEQIRLLALPGAYPESVRLIIYGRAPVSVEALEGLPEGLRVQRAQGFDEPGPNRGIVVLGLGAAASGRWDAVDVLLRLASTGNLSTGPSDVQLSLDGAPLSGVRMERAAPDGLVLRDVPARGGLLEARIAGEDALPADDTAQLRLPARRQLKVAVSASLGSVLEDAVRADPGLTLAEEDADVVFRQTDEVYGGDLPALEFAPMSEQETAFEIQYKGNSAAELALRDILQGLGLNLIDGAGLATEAARPVGVRVTAGESRRVEAWLELLDERFNFTASRAFPLFVSRAARWLVETDAVYAYLAAGRTAPEESTDFALTAPDNSATRLLGAALPPPRAGMLEPAGGGPAYPISLLSTAVTLGQPGVELPAFSVEAAGLAGPSLLVLLLILAALALLVGEWYAYQRGMMP
ncbi:BatA domain-containing protein [Candidatus Foliamicus sp.]